MTATELELSRKLLHAQLEIVKLEDRIGKVEAVLDAICIAKPVEQRINLRLKAENG